MSAAEQQSEFKISKQDQFMILYKPVHERLNRFVHSMVWNREDARDIISETVLQAYENFEKLRKTEAFLYFLFGIASRLAKRRSRRMKFRGEYNESASEKIIDSSANSGQRLEVEMLYKAMQKLPDKQREAVSLFEISGFSLAEIQQIQGGSISGVKSRIARGRESLAGILKKENEYVKIIPFDSKYNKAVIS